jgi:Carboxypeptidase regulatory-like domain/TonB dependent receptor
MKGLDEKEGPINDLDSGRASCPKVRTRMRGWTVLILLAALAFDLPTLVFGQGATGAINGTIVDSSGAVVPQARVVLHNVATGTELNTTTNGVGLYVLLSILPGRYTLQFSKEGFATTNQAEFSLAVNQTSTYNVVLTPGQVTNVVTVSAAAAQLESSTSELGTVIEEKKVATLPLNGRNFTQLLTLTPGVSPISTAQNSGGGGGFAGNAIGSFTFPSVNGQSNRSNQWLLDGFSDYSFVGNYGVQPILESIQEFKVQSHNDDAAYGQAMGGIVNVVTKSGTTSYHGSIWEFLRNNVLDARNRFALETAPYKQNQFGGAAGGPLVPKRFLSGAPKSFFYSAYEGFRSSRAAQTLFTTVSSQELLGDFSDSPTPVYNPYSTRPDPNNPMQLISTQFPGNVIPTSLLNPATLALAKALFPAPIQTGVAGKNGIDPTPNIINQDSVVLRLDHQFTDATSVWARFLGNNQSDVASGGIPADHGDVFVHGYQAAGALTHTFGGGEKVVLVRFGHTNQYDKTASEFPGISPNLWQEAGFNPLYASGFTGGKSFFPGASIGGFLTYSQSEQGNLATDIWEWAGDLSIVHGRQTFRMGADINTNGNRQPILLQSQGYSAFQTADPQNQGTTGNAMASFLLGLPQTANRRNLNITVHGGWVDGFYFMDEWTATSKLHVNAGLRYDVTLWPIYGSLKDNNLYHGDTDLKNGTYILTAIPSACGNGVGAPCIPGGVLPANVVVTPQKNHAILYNTYDNWQPRLGITYQLRPTTVLRAGVGKFTDNWADTLQKSTDFQGTWPDVAFLQLQNMNSPTTESPTPTAFAQDPFDFGTAPEILPAATPFNQFTTFFDPHFKNPYSIQWNFGIQHQLRANTTIDAAYVGSQDTRLEVGDIGNTALTPGPGNPQARAPYPYITPTWFDQSIGRSSYNAFQFKMDERTANGLTYLVSYTWSKVLNIGCDNYTASEGCSVPNPYDLDANRGVAGFNVTNLFSAAWVYELPFGSGKRFQAGSRALNAIVGNWAFNGIFTARSGAPFSVDLSGDVANTGNTASYERASQIGPAYASPRTAAHYLNTDSIVSPAPFTFGNMGRNTLRTPPVTNFDLSLFKSIPLPRETNLQFRTEFFNAFNFQALGQPDSTIGDPAFGSVSQTAQTEREIQFALKLSF